MIQSAHVLYKNTHQLNRKRKQSHAGILKVRILNNESIFTQLLPKKPPFF